MRGVDLSASIPNVTEEWLDKIYADGVRIVVYNLWNGNTGYPRITHAIELAKAKGFCVGGYFALTSSRNYNHYEAAKAFTGPDHWAMLDFVAVDVELEGITINQVQDTLNSLALENKPTMIYSGHWYWTKKDMDNTSQFNYVPLWTAQYLTNKYTTWTKADWDDLSEENMFTTSLPYGGWGWGNGLIARQFHGTINYHGLEVDLNIFYGPWIDELVGTPEPEPMPEPEPQPTKVNIFSDEFKNLAESYRTLVGRADLYVDDIKFLISYYG